MGKVMRHTLGASLNIRHNLSSSKGPKPLQLKLLTTYIPKTSAFTLAFSTSQRLRTTRASARTFFTLDTSVNAANQVVSVGADIAFDADPKFFACLVRFESSSVPTTLPTAYDVYPLDGRHDGGYYTVKDCVTIDVLPRTPGNNVYV